MNRNQVRYKIGQKAAEIMSDKLHPRDVIEVIPLIDSWVAAISSPEIKFAWQHKNKREIRDENGKEHALKCYIPGTCNSSSIIRPWTTMAPFAKVSPHILQLSIQNTPGYTWGSIICDYFSSINWHDEMMSDEMFIAYTSLRKQDQYKRFLREHFPYLIFRKK